ncbi:MAG: Fic family protein [Desulfobacteraceae bacterium]|nr:Fic family protein [Desulfobacteraceae bacterium]
MKRYKVAKFHLIPGTNILKNKPGITNQKDLDRFELLSFLARLDTVPDGDLSTGHIKQIHAHTLQDVYDWAGEFRDVPIEKGISVFCRPEFINQEIDRITKSIAISEFKGMSIEEFSKELSEIVSELNAVHPFLDGNGRAIRVYAQKISIAVGFRLDVSKLRGKTWNTASEKSFFGNNQDLFKILEKNLSRISEP